jgi:hypothetical protein
MTWWRCSTVKEMSGFYGRTFSEDELLDVARLAAADGVSLDEEIGLLRVCMRRVLEADLDRARRSSCWSGV